MVATWLPYNWPHDVNHDSRGFLKYMQENVPAFLNTHLVYLVLDVHENITKH